MTMTKKQRRARGLDLPPQPPRPRPGALPWKPRDICKVLTDGSSELTAELIVDANKQIVLGDVDADIRNIILTAVNERPTMLAALGTFSRWAIDVATLGDLAALEALMAAAGVSLQQVGAWAGKDGVPFSKSKGPKEAYLDPMSILGDSVEILDVVLTEREERNGEKDEVLRDLIKRIKRVVTQGTRNA